MIKVLLGMGNWIQGCNFPQQSYLSCVVKLNLEFSFKNGNFCMIMATFLPVFISCWPNHKMAGRWCHTL